MSGEFCDQRDADGARCFLAHGHRQYGLIACSFRPKPQLVLEGLGPDTLDRDAPPYSLATFEAEFYESVSSNDIAAHVQDRLLATVRRTHDLKHDLKTSLDLAQIAVNSANTKRDELAEQNADLQRLNAHLEAEVANIAARQLQAEAQRDSIAGRWDELIKTLTTERDEAIALVQTWVDIAESEKKSGQEFCRQIAALRKFKEYVHKRLDDARIPADPEPENNLKHGCRIEGRLNVLLGARDLAIKGDKGHYSSATERMFCHAMEASNDLAETLLELWPLGQEVVMEPDFWKYARKTLGSYDTTIPTGTRVGKRWCRQTGENRMIGEYTENAIIWRPVKLVPWS